MNTIAATIITILAFAAGAFISWLITRTRARAGVERDLAVANEKIVSRDESVARAVEDKNKAIENLERARQEQTSLERQLADARARLDAERVAADESRKKLTVEFENLANKILDEKSKKFTDQNKEHLGTILNPLREQLGEFKKKVEDAYDKESKDRRDLYNEISNLKTLNRQIAQDAVNLTNALKGDNKVMGDWGEQTLERILELSGLQEGREYEKQVFGRTEDGLAGRADIVVHLPEKKDVIVDSKVSLTSYERFYSAETEEEQLAALKAHVVSVRNHIDELDVKRYHDMGNINSLDFVLMFIPVEPAYFAAIRHDPNLIDYAHKKNVVLCCPTTLLVSLRTVANLWRIEDQSRNAQTIAKKAGDLYDKFVGFVTTLQGVQKQIHVAADTTDKAIGQLSTGRGSIVSRIENLRTLGVKGKKDIPSELLENEDEEDLQLEEPPDS